MVRLSGLLGAAVTAILLGNGGGIVLGQSRDDASSFASAEEPSPTPEAVAPSVSAESYAEECSDCCNSCFQTTGRKFLQSDHCFDDFVQPVSNPIFAKDPRSLTAR